MVTKLEQAENNLKKAELKVRIAQSKLDGIKKSQAASIFAARQALKDAESKRDDALECKVLNEFTCNGETGSGIVL